MRQLFIISANHLSTSAQERLLLKLSDTQWDQLSTHMLQGLQVSGYVHLQTCNRIEIIYEHHTDVSDDIIGTWLSLIDHKEIAEQHFDVCSGTDDCINYLLRLSLGFQSAIYGDDQILQQLKTAFEAARSDQRLSSLLERSYQSMMRTHKQVCRETDYKSQTVSLAYQALKAARNIIGKPNLKNKNLLIVGAGDMAKQILKYLPKFHFQSVTITNRTMSKAFRLAAENDINLVDYSHRLADKYEVVISCTDHGKSRLSELTHMELYVDLSLSSAHVEDLHIPYVLLDELQELIATQNDRRMACISQVTEIINSNQSHFIDWYNGWLERRISLV